MSADLPKRDKLDRILLRVRQVGGIYQVGYYDGWTGSPTRDFVVLATEVSARKARQFLADWLRANPTTYARE